MTNKELISYIKKRDKFYQGWDMNDYTHEELLEIKAAIDKLLKDLPEGYMLTSDKDHLK